MMSWAEFLIRSFAYRKKEKREWFKLRYLGYTILQANYIDPKRLPKTAESYMPLEEQDPDLKQKRIDAFNQAVLKSKQNKNGN